MRYSYSFVDQYRKCPFRWYLKYGLKMKEEQDIGPTHPFAVGHLLHNSIELGLDKGIETYYNKFPLIGDVHVEEVIKVTHYYEDIISMLPQGQHEVQIKTDEFIGIIDYVSENEDSTVDLWDFKYSNRVDDYMKSGQLHIYKYYYEKTTGKKVNSLHYLFVPKVYLKRNQGEGTIEFRHRLEKELNKYNVRIETLEYDDSKVDDFFNTLYEIEQSNTLEKKLGSQCYYCTYENYCIGGM